MVANSNHFYFDYKDGKYGYNTNPNRGADTFNPFNSGFDFDFNNNQIPVMTSATSPSGIVTASGYSGSAYREWWAFNPGTEKRWSVNGASSWIQYQSASDMNFSWLFIDFGKSEVSGRTVKLEISSNGSSWETILDETLTSNHAYMIHQFEKQYTAKYVKLTQTYSGGGYIGLYYMSLIK